MMAVARPVDPAWRPAHAAAASSTSFSSFLFFSFCLSSASILFSLNLSSDFSSSLRLLLSSLLLFSLCLSSSSSLSLHLEKRPSSGLCTSSSQPFPFPYLGGRAPHSVSVLGGAGERECSVPSSGSTRSVSIFLSFSFLFPPTTIPSSISTLCHMAYLPVWTRLELVTSLSVNTPIPPAVLELAIVGSVSFPPSHFHRLSLSTALSLCVCDSGTPQ